MISARVTLTPYSNQVLGVIKAKYSLGDKSAALNKFVEIYGDEVVEKEASEEYVKKILNIGGEHMRRHGRRNMTLKELDRLCSLD
jgi:hypothetical protein